LRKDEAEAERSSIRPELAASNRAMAGKTLDSLGGVQVVN